MDSVMFYVPSSTSASQSRRVPAVSKALFVPETQMPPPAYPPIAQPIEQNKTRIRYPDTGKIAQQDHSLGRACKDALIQERGSSTARSPPVDVIDNDSPQIQGLEFGIQQKGILAGANQNRDDDNTFIDIDQLLAFNEGSTTTYVAPNAAGMVKADKDEIRGASPASFGCSTVHTTKGRHPDSASLSESETFSPGTEPHVKEVELSSVSESDLDSPHVANGDISDNTPLLKNLVSSNHCNEVAKSHIIPDSATRRLSAHCPCSAPTIESVPAAHTGLAAVSIPASTRLDSTNLGISQSGACDTDSSHDGQSYVDEESADELGDDDYANNTDASSAVDETLRAAKRLRSSKIPPSTSFHRQKERSNCSSESMAPSTAVSQSGEIPVHGFLKLEAFGSDVVYHLSFVQSVGLRIGTASASGQDYGEDSDPSTLQEQATSRRVMRSRFSPEDDKLLIQLKEDECLSWDEIAEHFPERSKASLQVHYSTKLNHRSKTNSKSKRRRRS